MISKRIYQCFLAKNCFLYGILEILDIIYYILEWNCTYILLLRILSLIYELSLGCTHIFVHSTVILLSAQPASFQFCALFCLWDAKFLFQRVPRCNSIADLSLIIVFWTLPFGLTDLGVSPRNHKPKIINESLIPILITS